MGDKSWVALDPGEGDFGAQVRCNCRMLPCEPEHGALRDVVAYSPKKLLRLWPMNVSESPRLPTAGETEAACCTVGGSVCS